MSDASDLNPNGPSIQALLAREYPQATIALRYGSAWELLVAVMLSAQCTDTMVNKVTATLFRKYPSIESYAHADLKTFERDITSTGFFRMKAKHIIETATILLAKYGGRVPATMGDLTSLPGVARKTANIVLANAYGVVEGIAVDTHVARISQRLRLVPLTGISGKSPVFVTVNGTETVDYYKSPDTGKIEILLMGTVPRSDWNRITYRIIDHGRAVCGAVRPKCPSCPLRSLCPVSERYGAAEP